MSGVEDPGRPNPMRNGSFAAVGLALFAMVALVGGVMLAAPPTGPVSSPGPSSEAPPEPSSGAGPSPTGSPGATSSPDDAWAALDLPALRPVATLVADRQDAGGISTTATFTLTSLTSDTAVAAAHRLRVEPAVDLAVVRTTGTDVVTLRPAAPLTPGTVYRVTLHGADGGLTSSWAFAVRSPVHVTTTIPGDQQTWVPVDTGIEFTFDQDGVADMAPYFSISPAVEGRFERHGRTQVFVPGQLRPGTAYTVTVRKGLPRTGTGLTLEQDEVLRFETDPSTEPATFLRFGRDVIEIGPSKTPTFALTVVAYGPRADPDAPAPLPTSTPVVVYRFGSEAAAGDALAAFVAAPSWMQASNPLIPTTGLEVAMRFTARLTAQGEDSVLLTFPRRLPVGRYVVEIPGDRPAAAYLQVTPVSAWVSVLTDRTVAWVNDVSTGKAIKGATVSVVGGPPLGRTGGNGLMVAPTPASLLPPAVTDGAATEESHPILRVAGPQGTLLLPFDIGFDPASYRGEWFETNRSPAEAYWSILQTDRTLYRATDRIEAWGYVKARLDGSVPASVEVRVVSDAATAAAGGPAIVAAEASPNADGAYAVGLDLRETPLGGYSIVTVVDGVPIASRWLQVGVVTKPLYQLDVATDHLAVIAGTTIVATSTARFFDGTPAPGIGLVVDSEGDTAGTPRTTADGTARVRVRMPGWGDDPAVQDARGVSVGVRPEGPEEADISAWASVLVFPTAVHLAATGSIAGARLTVRGDLHKVDLAKVERALAADRWNDDPDGAAVRAVKVRATVSELIPVRRQVGTAYDVIEKVVRPIYQYDVERKTVGTRSAVTGASGGFSFALSIPDRSHEYEIALTASDGTGRIQHRTIQVGTSTQVQTDTGVAFRTANGGQPDAERYGIGEHVTLRMTSNGIAMPSSQNRYLYLVSQRGLVDASVTASPRFDRTFGAADAPGIFIIGVPFTGDTYAPKASTWADFDTSQRELRLSITSDRPSYRPGETAQLTARAADRTGHPVVATITVQAVDEKLFAAGGAWVPDILADLYGRVDSGIVRLSASHQLPTVSGPEGEGGDTSGGPGRVDFRDIALSRQLRTDASGVARVAVKLPDDLTSWHVTAVAITGGLQVGQADRLLPVGLPFFVEATMADEYLVADRPILRLRTFGDALRTGDTVEVTVASASLGLSPVTVKGRAGDELQVALPTLSAGHHAIDIRAVAPGRLDAAGKPLEDGLVRTANVVTSRLTTAKTAYTELSGAAWSPGGPGLTTYTFTDAGRGRYLPLLLSLDRAEGARADQAIAQAVAHDLLVDAFGRDPASLSPVAWDPTRYPIDATYDQNDGKLITRGLPLLPYGGPDPWLTARVAIVAPERYDQAALLESLRSTLAATSTARDLGIATLAGLASLGEPVLADLETATSAPDLTMLERIYLAIGFDAVGDEASASRIERSLLAAGGQRLGSWVRLKTGATLDDTLEATALLALVASGIGDPLADAMAAYVAANPARDTTHDLDLAGYVQRAIERAPRTAASFAYTVDGTRTVVHLVAGEAVTIALTASQRPGLVLEPVGGRVAVAADWREPVVTTGVGTVADLTLSRTLPSEPVATTELVVVDLALKAGRMAPTASCYEVVELVPSGLAAVTLTPWDPDPELITPSNITGQRVTFCAPIGPSGTARMRYAARVIGAGDFRWEPAIAQLPGAPEAAAITSAGTVTIAQR